MIIIFHVNLSFQSALLKCFYHNLSLGVDFFFVISGFLVTYLLLIEKSENKKINIFSFYLRRVLRIFPLYYLIILLSYLTFYKTDNNYKPFLYFWGNFEIIREGHWTGGWLTPLWSICIEEHFYWVVPLLVALLSIKFIKYVYGLIIVISIVTKAYFFSTVNYSWYYIQCHTLSTMDIIAIGGLLACLYFEWPFKINISSWLLIIPLLLIIALMSLINFESYDNIFAAMFSRYLIIIPFVAFFGMYIFNTNSSVAKIKQFKITEYLGNISYGIYMYQSVIMNKLAFSQTSVFKQLLFIVLSIIVTIVVSGLSYRFIEGPFLKLKKLIEKKTIPEISPHSPK